MTEINQLSEDHKKRMGHITKMVKDIVEMTKLLHPINSKKIGKKERAKICALLINRHLLPMENIILNLYIEANGLQDYFTKKQEELKDNEVIKINEPHNQSVN